MIRAWARRAAALHHQLGEVAELGADPRWWLVAGGAAIAWRPRDGYVVSDAEPASDTFIGHAVAGHAAAGHAPDEATRHAPDDDAGHALAGHALAKHAVAGHAPDDVAGHAVARAHAARDALRALDGRLPDQPLAVTLQRAAH